MISCSSHKCFYYKKIYFHTRRQVKYICIMLKSSQHLPSRVNKKLTLQMQRYVDKYLKKKSKRELRRQRMIEKDWTYNLAGLMSFNPKQQTTLSVHTEFLSNWIVSDMDPLARFIQNHSSSESHCIQIAESTFGT